MPLYLLRTTNVRKDGEGWYFTIRTPHASLEAIASDLKSGPIVVEKIIVGREAGIGSRFIVNSRQPLLMTTAMVSSIECQTDHRIIHAIEGVDSRHL